MGKNETCSPGTEIATKSKCEEASEWAPLLGLSAKSSVNVGHYNKMPYQCSVRFGDDDVFHFNTDNQTDNSIGETGYALTICHNVKN